MTCFVGYHGSTSRVEKFSAQRRQRSEYGDGFYFTDDFATAEHYGPVVGRYEICFCRPLHAHQLTLGDILAERSGQALPSRLRDQGAWITHTAQALGYDGLVLTLASVHSFPTRRSSESEERRVGKECSPTPQLSLWVTSCP